MSLSQEQLDIARKGDITQKLTPFLDRHLVYLLVENEEPIYGEKQVEEWEYELLKDTNMIKFIEEKWNSLHAGQPLPEEISASQSKVNDELTKLDESTKKTLELLASEEVQKSLKQDKGYNREYLAKQGIDDAKIYELYKYGKLQYNRGDYGMAADLLNNFRSLSTNQDQITSATWGKLAVEILTGSWSEANNELAKLREVIDNRNYTGSTLNQLNERTWLIHYALFIFFNGTIEKEDSEVDTKTAQLSSMIDLFLSSSYMSTIEASCPWILRYLVISVIATKQYKRLRDVVRAIDVETYEFQDPFTRLLQSLFVEYDFDTLPELIKEISVLLNTDYFLSSLDSAKIIGNLQELVITTVSKVYKEVTVESLATIFNSDAAAVEELLKSKQIAVVDGVLVSTRQPPTSVYQQVYEKTKAFNFKSNQILNAAFSRSE